MSAITSITLSVFPVDYSIQIWVLGMHNSPSFDDRILDVRFFWKPR